jgi:hypothetical protein
MNDADSLFMIHLSLIKTNGCFPSKRPSSMSDLKKLEKDAISLLDELGKLDDKKELSFCLKSFEKSFARLLERPTTSFLRHANNTVRRLAACLATEKDPSVRVELISQTLLAVAILCLVLKTTESVGDAAASLSFVARYFVAPNVQGSWEFFSVALSTLIPLLSPPVASAVSDSMEQLLRNLASLTTAAIRSRTSLPASAIPVLLSALGFPAQCLDGRTNGPAILIALCDASASLVLPPPPSSTPQSVPPFSLSQDVVHVVERVLVVSQGCGLDPARLIGHLVNDVSTDTLAYLRVFYRLDGCVSEQTLPPCCFPCSRCSLVLTPSSDRVWPHSSRTAHICPSICSHAYLPSPAP